MLNQYEIGWRVIVVFSVKMMDIKTVSYPSSQPLHSTVRMSL